MSVADEATRPTSAQIAERLERARQRTLDLLAPLSDAELNEQISPLQSPLVWDLAHIGLYEAQWVLGEEIDERYDAFRQPRSMRGELALLSPVETRSMLAHTRDRVLQRLERDGVDGEDPLRRNGFVYGLVVQHELQHIETMLQTLQLRDSPPYAGELASPGRCGPSSWTHLDAHRVHIGADGEPWAYDNELARHEVDLAAFEIATTPVTNAEWTEFVAAGGERPLYWHEGGRMRFGRHEDLPPDEPVCHVSYHQATAFARFAGARLPSEFEWESAARAGVLADTGRVWEWTRSAFAPIRDSPPSPMQSIRRCSSVMTTACCAADRGRAIGSSRVRASATGITPFATKSSPACASRATRRPPRTRARHSRLTSAERAARLST